MNDSKGSGHPKRKAPHRGSAKRSPGGRIGAKSRHAAKDLGEMGEIARNAAKEKFLQIRDSAAEYADSVQLVEQSFEQQIRDRPLKCTLIAAGIGMMLGRFWLRR